MAMNMSNTMNMGSISNINMGVSSMGMAMNMHGFHQMPLQHQQQQMLIPTSNGSSVSQQHGLPAYHLGYNMR